MDVGARMDTLRFLIRDRDSQYILAFDGVFDAEDIQIIRTPPRTVAGVVEVGQPTCKPGYHSRARYARSRRGPADVRLNDGTR